MEHMVKKTFILGDEWIFVKLYTGYKTADVILSEIVPWIVIQLQNQNVLSKWFFIRYSDPDFHIRLRFCLNSSQNYALAVSSIYTAIINLVKEGLIWKVQFDTYKREIERYGHSTIDYAEDIFHADSQAVIKLLSIIEDDQNESRRWLLAVKMIDIFLQDFNFTLDQKLEFIRPLSTSFINEFGFSKKEIQLQLNKKYRIHRHSIDEIILAPSKNAGWFRPLSEIIIQKSRIIKPIAAELLEMERRNLLEVPLNNLLGSYIHMMINRLFRSKQRIYELVLYDMLRRCYSSQIARTKKSCAQEKAVSY